MTYYVKLRYSFAGTFYFEIDDVYDIDEAAKASEQEHGTGWVEVTDGIMTMSRRDAKAVGIC